MVSSNYALRSMQLPITIYQLLLLYALRSTYYFLTTIHCPLFATSLAQPDDDYADINYDDAGDALPGQLFPKK